MGVCRIVQFLQRTLPEDFRILLAAIIVLITVSVSATWSCSTWKSETELRQSQLEESLAKIELANTEIRMANGIIREKNTELSSAKAEITRLGNELGGSNARTRQLEEDITKANREIDEQRSYIKCRQESDASSSILGFLGNLVAPGIGGAFGSTLGKKEC